MATAQGDQPAAVLIENVRIFDGKASALSAPTNVLVRGNRIERISAAPIPGDGAGDILIIRGGGRTLMPGLIDAHYHMMLASAPLKVALVGPDGYLNLAPHGKPRTP